MAAPRILVIPGSLRTGSHNVRLAALAAKELMLADAEVTRISLGDFPLPLYDADDESRAGPPPNAVKLKQLMAQHQGVLITSPEYNASIAPVLKNALDWISRVREKNEPALAAYRGRPFAIAAASPGRFGGARSLLALRQVLETGCQALVIPEQLCVAQAEQAFDDMDRLTDPRRAGELRTLVQRLVELARQIA
jgi:chromate reductase, NAD(P)H dehydrogenase (quinone)